MLYLALEYEMFWCGDTSHLRNLFLSPACVMATTVFVTDVPMLVPMMMGTAVETCSTGGRAEFHQIFITATIIIITIIIM